MINQVEDKKVVRRINKLKRLFKHYGLRPYAFSPGMRSYVLDEGDLFVDFNDNALKFVVPLLEELVKHRMHGSLGMGIKSKKKWWKRKEVV